MDCSLFSRYYPHRSLRVAGAAMLALEMAVFSPFALSAEPTEIQEDRAYLSQDQSFFAPLLGDIVHALAEMADVAAMTHTVLEGGVPHMVLFLEARPGPEDEGHPVVRMMRTLADNHQLGLEYQSTRLEDGAPLFGILLYQRFPTLEMAWETHPHENVASVHGAWRRPFADLSDVESVHLSDGRATLNLSEAASRRIDRLSELHGHRNYRLRGVEMAEAGDLGTYTWVPGRRSLPGVPAAFTCRLPRRDGQWKEGVTLDYLRQRFTVHAAAREQIRRELDLADDVNWTISAAAPRYSEPFIAWMVHAPEAGGRATQVPWYHAEPGAAYRWLHVQSPATPEATAVIPRHWTFTRSGENVSLLPVTAPNAEVIAVEEAFAAFLRQNMGGEMAIIMQGKVVGVVPIAAARPDVLALGNMPNEAPSAMEWLWNAANSGPERLAQSPTEAPPSVIPPDTFQVRLMAEPQDRQYVSVTHFAAPGYAPGTVVAVLNDVILDGHAVTGAYLETRDDKLFLRITLTPEAQEVLGGACFGNMGKQLAILYNDKLLCAPTIDDWEIEELSFKGMDSDWPEVAQDLVKHLAAKG